jgi:hypothetical protein
MPNRRERSLCCFWYEGKRPVTRATINFDRLLKLRLIVARFGEMDLAKWWNTRGQLGRLGTAAIRRGFPRTHYFAQARSVCAVAAHRCREVFDPPESVTLWLLPETIEEEFEAKWEHWLDQASEWEPFFHGLESLQENDLKTALQAFDAVTNHELEMSSRLRRSAEGRAVPISEPFSGTDQDIALLALGFARGEPGSLVVPYARRGAA